MKSVAYLLKISIIALIAVFSIVYYLRSQSFNKTYAPFDHPLLRGERPWTIVKVGELNQIENVLPTLSKAKILDPKVFLFLKLMPDSTSPVKDWKRESLEKAASLLQRFPEVKWIFHFDGNGPFLSKELLEIWGKNPAKNRIILSAREDGLIKDLREKAPEWGFVMGQSTNTQILMLSSLFLEPIAKLRGDILILPHDLFRDGLVQDRLLREVHRQQRFIIVDEPETPAIAQKLLAEGVDGISTSDLSIIKD